MAVALRESLGGLVLHPVAKAWQAPPLGASPFLQTMGSGSGMRTGLEMGPGPWFILEELALGFRILILVETLISPSWTSISLGPGMLYSTNTPQPFRHRKG